MRAFLIGLIALFCAACAQATVGGGRISVPLPEGQPHTAWPFPQAPRGSAIAPPGARAAPSTQAAPPEGTGPGGIDFGHWRGAEPAVYSPTFQTQLRARYAGRDSAAMQADLAANGFACENGGAVLQCRIEIMDHACDYVWYVTMEQGQTSPSAGLDQRCLGAHASRSR